MIRKTGFTLLEVLIVIIIIGILASIALPQYINTIEKARSAEAVENISALRRSMDRYWYDQVAMAASYTSATFGMAAAVAIKLDIDNPNNDTGKLYQYGLTDTSTMSIRTYTIEAQRIGKTTTHWVKWVQTNNNTGKLYKSNALGGPES